MPSFDLASAAKLAVAAGAVDYLAGGMIASYVTPSDSTDTTKSAIRTAGAVFVTAIVLQNVSL